MWDKDFFTSVSEKFVINKAKLPSLLQENSDCEDGIFLFHT